MSIDVCEGGALENILKLVSLTLVINIFEWAQNMV